MKKMMDTAKLQKKLRLQKGQLAAVVHPPDSYFERIGFPEGVKFTKDPGVRVDFLQVFTQTLPELEAIMDPTLRWIRYDGIFWISYPKVSSKVPTDLNRDTLWVAMKNMRFRPVTQVSFDEIWSAVRFRPNEAVGK